MNKTIAVVAVGLSAGLLLAGCGNNAADTEAAKPASTANAAGAANTTSGPPPIIKDLAGRAVPPGGVMSK